MADIQALKSAIDDLLPHELDEMFRYIEQRHQRTWWIVPYENLKQIEEVMHPVRDEAAQMTEDEINAAIDEAIDEVRRVYKADRGERIRAALQEWDAQVADLSDEWWDKFQQFLQDNRLNL